MSTKSGTRRKELAYERGFKQAARLHGLAPTDCPSCPFSVLDDPTITAAMAEDVGRADARDISRGRRAQ